MGGETSRSVDAFAEVDSVANVARPFGSVQVTGYCDDLCARSPCGISQVLVLRVTEGSESAVNTRVDVQAPVESSVFDGVKDAVTSPFSKEVGCAIMNDVDLESGSDK